MQQLETEFRKGKKFYLPHRPIDPFNGGRLNEISPNYNSRSYKKELIRICNQFFENTIAMDTTAKSFNSLSTKFFQTAAESIKEIFLQRETQFALFKALANKPFYIDDNKFNTELQKVLNIL